MKRGERKREREREKEEEEEGCERPLNYEELAGCSRWALGILAAAVARKG